MAEIFTKGFQSGTLYKDCIIQEISNGLWTVEHTQSHMIINVCTETDAFKVAGLLQLEFKFEEFILKLKTIEWFDDGMD